MKKQFDMKSIVAKGQLDNTNFSNIKHEKWHESTKPFIIQNKETIYTNCSSCIFVRTPIYKKSFLHSDEFNLAVP